MSLPTPTIKEVDKYFYDNNVLKTHFLSSLSSAFDRGESFFMKSLVPFISTYPDLAEDIKLFAREESAHSAAHRKLNSLIDIENNNNALRFLEEHTGYLLDPFYKLPLPLKVLITECLEHITYCLCEMALKDTEEFSKVSSDAYDLFQYHCIEETGSIHSSIAGKVYNRLLEDSKYSVVLKLIRKPVFILTLIGLSKTMSIYIIYLYKVNNDFSTIDFIRGIHSLFNRKGWVRKALVNSINSWS